MHAHQHLNLTLLTAPDEGFPGIPGAGPSRGSGGGLPGIPGGGPSGIPGSGSSQPARQPAPSQSGWGAPAPMPGEPGGGDGGQQGQPQFARPEPQHSSGGGGEVYELAGWGSRFAAWLLDAIFVSILTLPVIGVAAAIGLDTGTSSTSGGSASFSAANGQVLLLMLLYILVVLFYAPLTMTRMQGSTPGKRLIGIRVVRADGLPVTFGFAFLREVVLKGIVVQAVSFVTIGLGALINYLWPLWDSENRALHDMAAKSRVVRR